MVLPYRLNDKFIKASTAVVGDEEIFFWYLECGFAWRDWYARAQENINAIERTYGPLSPDVVEALLTPPKL